jgi:hypothetical protein
MDGNERRQFEGKEFFRNCVYIAAGLGAAIVIIGGAIWAAKQGDVWGDVRTLVLGGVEREGPSLIEAAIAKAA